jgi:O-antigen/teichoic acid export membrane protein
VKALRSWRAALAGWSRQSRFARNTAVVAGANAMAQVPPLLAAPVLSRLYAPESFGGLALFSAALGLGLAAATGRFEWSVPNARRPRLAAALVVWGALLLLMAASLLLLAWWLVAPRLPTSWALLAAAGWLLPVALLGAGLQQMLQAWHVRQGALAPVGRARIAQSVANVGVSLATPAWGSWGLVAGAVAGAWVGLGTLWRHARGLPAAARRVRPRSLVVAWRRFGTEALWSTLASVLNAASFAVMPLLLARHYGAADLGYYALMQRLAYAPIGLVGAAVSQSFWAEAARLVRSDPAALDRLYRRSCWRLAWLALPIGALALAGPWFVGPLLGTAQWQAAGAVLAVSAPLLMAQTVFSPLSHLIVHGRQHWQAMWDAARIVLACGLLEGLGRSGADFIATVASLSILYAAMYLLLHGANLHALRRARRG